MARSRLAIALALAVGCAALTGAAFAGPPDSPGNSANAPGQQADPGKSAQAPGQEKKSEPAAQGTAASASHGKSEAKGKSDTKGKSASAPGKTKASKSAKAAAKGQPATAGVKAQGEGQLKTAHKKVLICHSTGSATNPFVVISVSVNALKSGHDKLGTREAVLAPGATSPRPTADVHSGRTDFILGPSSPGKIENKAALEAQCAQQAGVSAQQPAAAVQPAAVQQAAPQAAAQAPAPAAEAAPAGGVAGVQGALKAKPKAKPAGGVLGALGAVAGEELPFTGLPLWIATLIGLGLVSAGFGARRAMR